MKFYGIISDGFLNHVTYDVNIDVSATTTGARQYIVEAELQ